PSELIAARSEKTHGPRQDLPRAASWANNANRLFVDLVGSLIRRLVAALSTAGAIGLDFRHLLLAALLLDGDVSSVTPAILGTLDGVLEILERHRFCVAARIVLLHARFGHLAIIGHGVLGVLAVY